MSWDLSGNAGTDATQNFLGSTDAQPLVIRTGDVERMRIDGGSVGHGIPGRVLGSSSGWSSLTLSFTDRTLLPVIAGGTGISQGKWVIKASDGGLDFSGPGAVSIARAGPDWFNDSDPTILSESLVVTHTENGRAPGVTFMNDGGGHFVQRFVFGGNANLPDGEAANFWADWRGLLIEGNQRVSVAIGGLDNPIELDVTAGSVAVANVLTVGGNANFAGNLNVAGDVLLTGGADCAEDFDVADSTAAEPGTVMILGESGSIEVSRRAYDRKVAGVISGGGSYKPALTLDKRVDAAGPRRPLALMGKVYCKVDADLSPIGVGDLLTTSPTPGHAMKAVDRAGAFGAVLGKALMPLRQGRTLLPILVALQ